MKAARVAAVAVLPFLGACEADFLGVGMRDFEGVYSYAGTVDEALGDVVVGDLVITRQRHDHAEVTIDWSYFDGGVEVVNIATAEPATAELWADGRIRFDFEGDLLTNGRVVPFRLEHDGELHGGRLTGYWRLTTDLPTDDSGTFTAQRER
jgi:hypothetical protein